MRIILILRIDKNLIPIRRRSKIKKAKAQRAVFPVLLLFFIVKNWNLGKNWHEICSIVNKRNLQKVCKKYAKKLQKEAVIKNNNKKQ